MSYLHRMEDDLAAAALLDEHGVAQPGEPAFLLILDAQVVAGAEALLAKRAAFDDWLAEHEGDA